MTCQYPELHPKSSLIKVSQIYLASQISYHHPRSSISWTSKTTTSLHSPLPAPPVPAINTFLQAVTNQLTKFLPLPTTPLSFVARSIATPFKMLRQSLLRSSQRAARVRPATTQQVRKAHAISNPTLANIEKRWEGMPPQEQADLWMALRDRMKVNWAELTLQEKKAGM